jgi:hypothetical protein
MSFLFWFCCRYTAFELGISDFTIDANKGCYTGQEIMSRYFRLMVQANSSTSVEEKRSKIDKISPKRLVGGLFQDIRLDHSTSDLMSLLSPGQILHNSEGWSI